ncbi:hypothetical protein B0537_03195 [Desulforamulus ferrireducens]|uniref:Uncharacterized protein n=1 Tax=Desulforamulus ferrireducens TaxID=1833852 RepID=A0A1S6ITT7_9FIRM|nr:hypothetical protein B0537_03195 [Desulforamulus ferrireducens]
MLIEEIKLFLELKAHKDEPERLVEIFYQNRDTLLKLKEKHPEWRTYLKPQVLEALREKGLPVD